jgi:DNA (cytosine-5)-methyltransferase 1
MIKDFSVDYHVRVYKICCSNFDIPQNRKRVIIIGVKKQFGLFFPVLKHHECKKSLSFFLLNKEDVSNNYFLSTKAISGILRRREVNFKKGNGFGPYYLNIDGFCNTITANYWRDGYSSLIKYSESEIRRLTEIELKRIQSFPDSFNFVGSKKEKYTQIGNAVPPKLAYFLGKEIISFFNVINSL